MNTAIILAGGTGQRMHQEIPKQFINVNDKPLIIYTLEHFKSIHRLTAFWLYVSMDGMIF